jgi:hypothetical protein
MTTNKDLVAEHVHQDRLDQFVAAHVHLCLSPLVATLARAYPMPVPKGKAYGDFDRLAELTEQAAELSSPVDDYEEAAIQAGLSLDENDAKLTTWEGVCVAHDLDPYQREVFEHWAIDGRLAELLEAEGEKVDCDFAGLVVWARTTSGQAISMDSVIRRAYERVQAELREALK